MRDGVCMIWWGCLMTLTKQQVNKVFLVGNMMVQAMKPLLWNTSDCRLE